MASYPTPQSVTFNTFKGIRTRNGIAAHNTISAVECKNVDFIPSSYDAGVNIATSLGNVKTYELTGDWLGYTIIKGFEFESENATNLLFYCENTTQGVLLKMNGSSAPTAIFTGLNVTGKANGITMVSRTVNTFVFTNGEQYRAWIPDGTTTTQTLSPTYNGTALKGLALAEQDGSIVIGGDNGIVLASSKEDITNFNYNASESATKAWYQSFGKAITAIVSMTGGLIIFTDEDNTVLSGNFSNPTTSAPKRYDANIGGCLSFESWVKHDKYLFFYDNRQKNVYYYTQNDYGQMILGEPVAPEVQKYFSNINRCQMTSYIGNNRSEIWVITDQNKLIFDFFVKEWGERYCQELSGYFVYENDVYSYSSNKCFKEKTGNRGMFDEQFYPSEYKTQIINLGSFSNMKEMEFQPLLSVSSNYNNTFYIDCLIDGKKTKSKYVEMFSNGAVWGNDTDEDEYTPENEIWAYDGESEDDQNVYGQVFPKESDSVIQQVKSKFISNWYYLQFTFRTATQGDDFSINCIELKGITQETDTTGRK